MTENPRQLMTPPGPDEKTAPVMFYTASAIFWGDLIVKERIRVSTWLRNTVVPDTLCITAARMLITTAPANPPKPILVPELHLPTHQVLAYHLLPPAKEPLDYDPAEPNRCMDPVSVFIGTFRMDGLMRLSTRSTLRKYLENPHETFTSVYDADITNFVIPALGVVRVPVVQVRQAAVQLAIRAS